MPFSIEFLNNAAKFVEVKSVESDFEIAKKYIIQAIKLVQKANPHVNPKDVDIYIHGSYANKTNIYFPSNLEICVELKKTATYDPQQPQEYKLYNNYFVDYAFDFSPLNFKELLYSKLSEITEQNCTQSDKCIVIPAFGKSQHIIEITPCFSFNYVERDGAVFKGVLLYDQNSAANIVTFPKLHAKNGDTKDIKTAGNFKKTVRLFKSLNAIYAREHKTKAERGYFIECMLFNVPDNLFRGSAINDVFYKVLNYLLHCGFDGWVCQNLIWQLFGTAAEFWDTGSALNFIRTIKNFYATFSEMRTTLI